MNRSDIKVYRLQPICEAFARILGGTRPWIAIGDFLDDWRRTPVSDRGALVAEPIGDDNGDPELRRWAAFCAAMVEWLCWNEQPRREFPAWTSRPDYALPDPWFLYSGWKLRAWQLVTTPAPFKMRNIFGGDHMLDRV